MAILARKLMGGKMGKKSLTTNGVIFGLLRLIRLNGTCTPIFLLGICVLCLGSTLKAQNVIVTSLADNGPGTLREALATADPGSKIKFAVEGTIFLLTGQLLVDKNVQIIGPGADELSIDGQNQFGIFVVSSNVTAVICGLTLTNAVNFNFSPEGSGGGIRNLGNLTVSRCVVTDCISEFGVGGGIYSQFRLRLVECSISNNLAAFGGGIADDGHLIVDRCTINGNRSMLPGGSGGAGIHKIRGDALLNNSTISGNNAFDGSGGGIFANTFLEIESCTIVSNRAEAPFQQNVGRGGGLFIGPAARVVMANTIVAGNSSIVQIGSLGPDIFGSVFSKGWNLIQNTSNAVIAGVLKGNQTGVDPQLGPLQDNGGPTLTHALLTNSPAIDTGAPFGFLRIDQRGVPRPQDGNGDGKAVNDIGSYEKQGICLKGKCRRHHCDDFCRFQPWNCVKCSHSECIEAQNDDWNESNDSSDQ